MRLEIPPLPGFLAPLLPFRRAVHILQSGPDAGRRIHLIDEGDPAGRPVLMLHGNPTWSFLWRQVIALLPGFRCVAPDLLGLGLSDRLPRIADHTVDRHGAAMAEVVEALDLRGVILVGQDWGGPIAAQVGARMPERIAGLVLANTAVTLPTHPKGTLFHRFARVPGVSDLVFRGLGFPQNVLGAIQGDKRSIRGAVSRAYRWPLRTWRDRVAPLALARMVPDGPDHPSMPALRRGEEWVVSFRGPAALVWGMRDPILGKALRHLERALPDAPVTRTAAGHFLQEEVPSELAGAVADAAQRI
ncbi:MAG: cis-3-alkyl-4-acyloxetan-2-one decarboxylase [Acidobacteriota bacterium]|jgi:haloalkane dehalogenase|nr:cis-3-alkyl-4-acyloxetan-2-one decarboxylase [Acidobacteriota bacterium]